MNAIGNENCQIILETQVSNLKLELTDKQLLNLRRTTMGNKVQLSGHLGKDPEVRFTQGGKQVTTASLATSNDYKKGDEWFKLPPSWHKCIAFGDVAEQLANYRKGSKVSIEGKIQYRTYRDKDGMEHLVTEIFVFQVEGEATSNDNVNDDVPF
jgi:single-strand DNA-binding protein